MSFHEISIAVRAENRASATFRGLALDIANLGAAFGVLSNEQVKLVSIFFTIIRVAQSSSVILKSLTASQTALNAATAAGVTVQTTLTGATVAHQGSLWGLIKAKIAATVATWGFNAATAAKITLLTLGAGAVVVAAAAMAALAMQTRAAASAVRDYNTAVAETPSYSRTIRRAGEEDLRRRGIE